MAMDQEVDVKLFITCRLCLDEPGSYQIVPCIKGQIYYCFGIEVDPFDGLPQLICKKCKGMLADYYTTKNLFVEKQKQLHDKLPQNDKDAKSSTPPKTESVPKESSATVEVAPAGAPVKPAAAVPGVAAKVARHDTRRKKTSWKKAFNKHFVCIICSKSFLTAESIKKHSSTHKRFINKHEKVFKKYLTVRLNKIDKEKNSTGGLQNVVVSKNKIIERLNSQYHHSFYLKKEFEEGRTDTVDRLKNGTDENENVAAKRLRVSSDSSDDQIIKGKKRKTGRLESISSTQTVILEETNDATNAANTDDQSNTNETEIVNPDYINLDDTSSDCPKNNTELEKKRIMPKRRQVKAEVADYKAIQNIVTMCHKNYIKKVQADTDLTKSTFSESSLKHKVLSLGRKVLNKQGFACTGLLRYMEHKDLDITWTPTTNDMQQKGSNFVRIMTKLKSREDSENDDACWKNLHDISFCRDTGVEVVLATVPDVRSDDQASLQSAQTDEDPSFAGAPSETNDSNYRNKLLNKTPVANPRQLPKKNNVSETKLVVATDDAAMMPSNLISNCLEDAQVDDDNMCLPIITSTTSLSVNVSEKEKQEVSVLEKPAPRIKVKPASELMTARALNNQETEKEIWTFNKIQSSLPHHLTNTAVTVHAPMTNSHMLASNNHTDEQRRQNACILLDSLQFPNTKTSAPFQYFRKVLLVHGLQLLDLNEHLPEHFNCLIKFRLKLKQNTKRPIEVLLSLHCSKDYFCFSFKDTNSKIFDPNQLSAFWQWELLKIYKTDVTEKILENAMKVGKEVHEYTNLFLSLLKSINLIKEA
ncbi:uncharacterized protein LOC134661718 [Cydia amplana]|uniref:uncharacterized protein LOC134661718 n=1 Tax=Cydia amplana TaxID=1869771 RepID=UPI002FE58F5D